MKPRYILYSILVCLCSGCSNNRQSPDAYFSKEQQAKIIAQSVRYSAKLPGQATHETKVEKKYDKYYHVAAKECDFRKCLPENEREKSYYFLMTRQARSIWPAREAIGGKFRLNDADSIIRYEELFRTWKMAEDSLNTRAFELFDRMVKGEDLTPFRSKFKGDRYIEFPDDRFYFSKEDMQWHDHAFDTLKLN
jgi:hypothetical protein